MTREPICLYHTSYIPFLLRPIFQLFVFSAFCDICRNAFNGCALLTNITIPDSVATIGNMAFGFCKSLISIAIPAGVAIINEDTFECCSSLTGVTIPDSVTEIGFCAFVGCGSLTSITIPDSVIKIHNQAFDGCQSLTGAIYKGKTYSVNIEKDISLFEKFNCDLPREFYDAINKELMERLSKEDKNLFFQIKKIIDESGLYDNTFYSPQEYEWEIFNIFNLLKAAGTADDIEEYFFDNFSDEKRETCKQKANEIFELVKVLAKPPGSADILSANDNLSEVCRQ